jgi:hypothetical protein
MALRMDMDLNILAADKCSAKLISKFLLVLFFVMVYTNAAYWY